MKFTFLLFLISITLVKSDDGNDFWDGFVDGLILDAQMEIGESAHKEFQANCIETPECKAGLCWCAPIGFVCVLMLIPCMCACARYSDTSYDETPSASYYAGLAWGLSC